MSTNDNWNSLVDSVALWANDQDTLDVSNDSIRILLTLATVLEYKYDGILSNDIGVRAGIVLKGLTKHAESYKLLPILNCFNDSSPTGTDLQVDGRQVLDRQVDGDLWFVIRWSLKNACCTDLKSQQTWSLWAPILEFFVNVIALQLERSKQNDEPCYIGHLINSCDPDDGVMAIEEFTERMFINSDMSIDYISSIYETPSDTPSNVQQSDSKSRYGLSSLNLRQQLLFIAYEFIRWNDNTKSDLFLNRILENLLQMTSDELNSFFEQDLTFMSDERVSFTTELMLRLLEVLSEERYSIENLYDEDFEVMNQIQLSGDPIIKELNIYQVIFLCHSVLISLWFKKNSENHYDGIFDLLKLGDIKRLQILQRFGASSHLNQSNINFYNQFKNKFGEVKRQESLIIEDSE